MSACSAPAGGALCAGADSPRSGELAGEVVLGTGGYNLEVDGPGEATLHFLSFPDRRPPLVMTSRHPTRIGLNGGRYRVETAAGTTLRFRC